MFNTNLIPLYDNILRICEAEFELPHDASILLAMHFCDLIDQSEDRHENFFCCFIEDRIKVMHKKYEDIHYEEDVRPYKNIPSINKEVFDDYRLSDIQLDIGAHLSGLGFQYESMGQTVVLFIHPENKAELMLFDVFGNQVILCELDEDHDCICLFTF